MTHQHQEEAGEKPVRRGNFARWAITVCGAIAIAAKFIFPEIKVDAVTLGLLVFMALPWLSDVIKSIELPGGFKVELATLDRAADKILEGPAAMPAGVENRKIPDTEEPFLLQGDANLALVGLRIEIEKTLYRLIRSAGEPMPMRHVSLSHLLRESFRLGLIDQDMLNGLRIIVNAANSAAHGAKIENGVLTWVQTDGQSIIEKLRSL
ncbi:hypothetical protein [Deinococcus aquaticus]|uniref:hypothetical protein n=1 Tax=Deinococcus aquaticus TaxID=328692 RepID=UPI003F4569EB